VSISVSNKNDSGMYKIRILHYLRITIYVMYLLRCLEAESGDSCDPILGVPQTSDSG